MQTPFQAGLCRSSRRAASLVVRCRGDRSIGLSHRFASDSGPAESLAVCSDPAGGWDLHGVRWRSEKSALCQIGPESPGEPTTGSRRTPPARAPPTGPQPRAGGCVAHAERSHGGFPTAPMTAVIPPPLHRMFESESSVRRALDGMRMKRAPLVATRFVGCSDSALPSGFSARLREAATAALWMN